MSQGAGGALAVPAGRLSAGDVLAMGIATAFATGVIESAVLLVRRQLLHSFAWTSADAYWITPLNYLILFAPLIIVLAAGARLMPRVVGFRLVLTVFLWLGAVSLIFLLVHRRIALVAQLALAAGAATALARGAARRPDAWRRGARRAATALAALVALLTLAPLVRYVRERRALASLPAALEGTPSVLLIILDTVRAASLALYGGRPPAGGLERLATGGVVFDHAYATASWTLPSHGSIFTGAYPHHLSTGWLHALDRRQGTLAEAFQAAGYRTAGFTANLYYTSDESGLTRGFQHYRDYRLSRRQTLLTSALGQLLEELRIGGRPARRINERKFAPRVSAEVLDWLARATRPSFVFVNYFDAHLPYHPSPAWRGRLPSTNGRLEAYEEAVAGLDADIDSLLTTLAQTGGLRNTIVVIAADHGESVGDHGLPEHGFGLYVQDLHVPLVMAGPGIAEGRRVAATVSLIDLGATLADLAGLTTPFPGHSLAGLWRGDSAAAISSALAELDPPTNPGTAWPMSHGPMRSIIVDSLHLIHRGDGAESLFNLARDPSEERDLIADSAYAGRLGALRSALSRADVR